MNISAPGACFHHNHRVCSKSTDAALSPLSCASVFSSFSIVIGCFSVFEGGHYSIPRRDLLARRWLPTRETASIFECVWGRAATAVDTEFLEVASNPAPSAHTRACSHVAHGVCVPRYFRCTL